MTEVYHLIGSSYASYTQEEPSVESKDKTRQLRSGNLKAQCAIDCDNSFLQ